MPLQPGARLGPYEVVALLGTGGMGEVYRGRDPRLARDIAIKVLPTAVTADPDRLHRFEQEAKAAAALNHPNILAVYDIGQHNGSPYIVSELLEGQTLRAHLTSASAVARTAGQQPSQRRLPARKAVDYALQMVRGLSAAHDKGITHRDLKPENVFLTTDGQLKILDFGLAKLAEPAVASIDAQTPTVGAATGPGVVLGTIGYMSPEQVRGQTADHRSDIFAFGATFYEMLSGHRAFDGGSSADTMTAILNEHPPTLSATDPELAPGLSRIVERCLEKSPTARFQSTHDLGFALEGLSTHSGASKASKVTRRRSVSWLPWAVAAADDVLTRRGVDPGSQILPPLRRGADPRALPDPTATGGRVFLRRHREFDRDLGRWALRGVLRDECIRNADDLAAHDGLSRRAAASRNRGWPSALLVSRQSIHRIFHSRNAQEGSRRRRTVANCVRSVGRPDRRSLECGWGHPLLKPVGADPASRGDRRQASTGDGPWCRQTKRGRDPFLPAFPARRQALSLLRSQPQSRDQRHLRQIARC